MGRGTGWATVHGVTKELDTTEWLSTHTHTHIDIYGETANTICITTHSYNIFSLCCYWVWDKEALITTGMLNHSGALLNAGLQANKSKRRGVQAKNTTLFGNLANWEDGRLMSRNSHLVEVWMPGSVIEPEREAARNLSQKAKRERKWKS